MKTPAEVDEPEFGMPPTTRTMYEQAARTLAERDAVMQLFVDAVGFPRIAKAKSTHFAALLEAVLHQQLAGSAARAIYGRLIDALDGNVTPDSFLALPFTQLREVGLSNNKALSLCDLAEKVTSSVVVLSPRHLARQDDEQVIAMLSSVRGIGKWTSQMFLMFQLRRLDVWPAGDLGVRRGFGLAWRIAMPSERELEPLGNQFAPYRSVAAWYCWRACELYGGNNEP